MITEIVETSPQVLFWVQIYKFYSRLQRRYTFFNTKPSNSLTTLHPTANLFPHFYPLKQPNRADAQAQAPLLSFNNLTLRLSERRAMLASAFPNRVSSESHECSHSDGRVAFEVDEVNITRRMVMRSLPTLFTSAMLLLRRPIIG